MILKVKRFQFNEKATIGKFYINDKFHSYTLEDVVRPDGVKIFGETAIPAGIYRVEMYPSARFKRMMPCLMNVPNFTGILIHKGNTDVDTHGCILLGNVLSGPDLITHSTEAFNAFFPLFEEAIKKGEIVTITIE